MYSIIQREPKSIIMVIWVKISQTETIIEICFIGLIRETGQISLMKQAKLPIKGNNSYEITPEISSITVI